jgi:hypothetical protein
MVRKHPPHEKISPTMIVELGTRVVRELHRENEPPWRHRVVIQRRVIQAFCAARFWHDAA